MKKNKVIKIIVIIITIMLWFSLIILISNNNEKNNYIICLEDTGKNLTYHDYDPVTNNIITIDSGIPIKEKKIYFNKTECE